MPKKQQVMIDVREVKLDIRIPSDELCIVAQQPFVRFSKPEREPFRWADTAIDSQLAAIERTLDLALEGLGGRPPTFVVFPEYAVPGARGARLVDQRLRDVTWPNDCIVIAGIDGLDHRDYEELWTTLAVDTAESISPEQVPLDKWVNSCVLWAKEQDGTVRCWIQLKVRPCWLETGVTSSDMHRGSRILTFKGSYDPSGHPCRFATFICYDWVVENGGVAVRDEFVQILDDRWKAEEANTSLDWLFVIQKNVDPMHRAFLGGTRDILADRTHAFVDRSNAVVLHLNVAGSDAPARGGDGGFSSCVFSPDANVDCLRERPRPTVYLSPNQLGRDQLLGQCKDVVFREVGECIHVFTLRVPRFLVGNAENRTLPITEAQVHAVNDSIDPRLSGSQVPASVKWINNSLDNMVLPSDTFLRDASFKQDARAIEADVIDVIRHSSGYEAADLIERAASWLSVSNSKQDQAKRGNPDLWTASEEDALQYVLDTLTCLGVAYKLKVAEPDRHGAILTDSGFVDIVVIRGRDPEDCRRHFDSFEPRLQGPDPVLVIVRGNLSMTEGEIDTIYHNVRTGVQFLDYHKLAMLARSTTDAEKLKESLDAYVPENRRLI